MQLKSQKERGGNGAEAMLKDRTAETPKVMKTIKPQVQETPQTLSSTGKMYRKHTRAHLLKTRDRESPTARGGRAMLPAREGQLTSPKAHTS